MALGVVMVVVAVVVAVVEVTIQIAPAVGDGGSMTTAERAIAYAQTSHRHLLCSRESSW